MAPMAIEPTRRNEYTGSALLDRIQGQVRDLVEHIRGIGWLKQRTYAALSTDTTIATSSDYAVLVESPITTVTRTSHLLIVVSTSGTKTTAGGVVSMRLYVDNVVVKGTNVTTGSGEAFVCGLMARVAVDAGRHTVSLRWQTSSSSATVRASSVINEHACLWAEEDAA